MLDQWIIEQLVFSTMFKSYSGDRQVIRKDSVDDLLDDVGSE